jgi:hypothetical protein
MAVEQRIEEAMFCVDQWDEKVEHQVVWMVADGLVEIASAVPLSLDQREEEVE